MKSATFFHKKATFSNLPETLKTLWWIPLLNLILLILAIPVNNSMPLYDFSDVGYDLVLDGPFSLYNGAEKFPFLLIVLAVISAFGCFNFLFNKKHQTAMLLTGSTRSSLFISRFIYGILSLFVPIIIAMGATVASNFIQVRPDSFFIIRNSLIITGIMILTVFAVFSAAALIAALIGRKTEFFTFNLFWVLSVLAVLFTVGNITEAFLNGAYSEKYLGTSFSTIFYYRCPKILNTTWTYSILTVFWETFRTFAEFSYHKSVIEMPSAPIAPGDKLASNYPPTETPLSRYSVPVLPIILVFLFGVLAAVLAYFAFCKRKAEIAEKPNACKPLSIAFSAITSTAIASSLLFTVENLYLDMLIFALAFFVLYFLLYGLCRASLRKIWKCCRAPVITLLIAFALIFTMIFGCFGYSSYIPSVSEVLRVSVELGGGINASFTVCSEEDILKISDVHRFAITVNSRFIPESDSQYRLTLVYALKNGKTVTRYYYNLDFSIASSLIYMIPEDEIADRNHLYELDPNRTDWPDEEEALNTLYEGMSYSKMIEFLGKPYTDIGSGIHIFLYKLSNGKTLKVSVVYDKVLSFHIDA